MDIPAAPSHKLSSSVGSGHGPAQKSNPQPTRITVGSCSPRVLNTGQGKARIPLPTHTSAVGDWGDRFLKLPGKQARLF